MGTCVVCTAQLPLGRYRTRTLYCSGACRQKAHRDRRTPEQDARIKEASNERHKVWRAANPERARELNRRWVAKNREKTRQNTRRFLAAHPTYGRAKGLRIYGLSIEAYEVLFDRQSGLCAVCGQPESSVHPTGAVRRLAVDHDHATKAIRGLLCHHCNIGIGHLRDDPDRLEAAALYLRRATSP